MAAFYFLDFMKIIIWIMNNFNNFNLNNFKILNYLNNYLIIIIWLFVFIISFLDKWKYFLLIAYFLKWPYKPCATGRTFSSDLNLTPRDYFLKWSYETLRNGTIFFRRVSCDATALIDSCALYWVDFEEGFYCYLV